MSMILLVDDEPQILEILSSYLQKDGFHVVTAETGTEALEMASSMNPDCMVLDLMLPDLSGEEVCREIRKQSRVPILMLTAKSGESDRVQGLEIGADDYLVKPFSPRELVARVRAILRRSGNQHNQEITQMAIQTYEQNHKWDEQVFEKMEAVSSVLVLELTLYDAQHQLLMAWGGGMQQSRLVDDIPLISRGIPIGYLAIAHNDQNTYQSMEDHFQMAHTNAMQWTMFALILFVILISILLARTLVRPLVQMSAAAKKVAKGNLHVRVATPPGKDEISSLVDTFNNLVHSLQHQEELRKRLTSDIAHERQ